MEGTRRLEGARFTLQGGVGLLNCIANIELEKSFDGPSSSLRKSVENAHALMAHTYGMMSPIKSKLQ